MIGAQAITDEGSNDPVPPAVGTVHIVFNSLGANSLRRALKHAHLAGRVLCFPDGLAIGPIDPPDPAARVDWMVAMLESPRKDWFWLPSRVSSFWKATSSPQGHRVVWFSRRSVYEFTGFLEWVWRMGDAPYDVVDLTDVEVDRPKKSGGSTREAILSLAMTTHLTIASEKLWDRAQALTCLEIENYKNIWARLRISNLPVRVAGPRGLEGVPISAFDENLMAFASDDWRRAYYLIGHVLADGDLDYFQVSDHFLAARVVALIRTGRLALRQSAASELDQSGYSFGSIRLTRGSEVRCLSR